MLEERVSCLPTAEATATCERYPFACAALSLKSEMQNTTDKSYQKSKLTYADKFY